MTFLAVVLLAVAQRPPEPEPIVIPPPAPVHGLVVDQDGRPVEGAELFLSGVPEDLSFTRRDSWTGRSDTQGHFVADRSSFWLAGTSSTITGPGASPHLPPPWASRCGTGSDS